MYKRQLYDRQFIEVLRNLNDPTPFLRGIVAELGFKRKEIPYEQPKRLSLIHISLGDSGLPVLLKVVPEGIRPYGNRKDGD